MVELHVQYSLFLHLVPLFFNVHRAPPVSQKIKEGYVLKSCQYQQQDSSANHKSGCTTSWTAPDLGPESCEVKGDLMS